jgi:atypical dual specificity phosphatase
MSRVGCFGQISEINDHLYLSGAHVLKPDKIRQKGITCIVNATVEEPSLYLAGMDYLKIRIDDNPYARLDAYFDLVADKIKGIKDKSGKTLVHCVAGVSRSASLVCAYLIKYENMSLRQAYQYVKMARPIIRPNVGFWKQLIDYEKRLHGASTVQMVPARYGCDDVPDVYIDETRAAHPSSSNSSSTLSSASFGRPYGSAGGRSSLSAIAATNGHLSNGTDQNHDGLNSRLSNMSLTNGSSIISSRSTQSSPLSSRLGSRYYRRGASFGGSTFPGSSGHGGNGYVGGSNPLALVGSPLKSKTKGNFFSSLYNSTTDFMFPTF